MSPDLLNMLFEGFWASSAAVALVLLLRRPWRNAFGARFAPMLWAIVPAALLAIALPARVVELPVVELTQSIEATLTPAARPAATIESGIDWRSVLAIAWLLGSVLSAAYFIRLQRHFQRRLGRTAPISGRLHTASRADVGPAVLGLLRPRIVLPSDFAQRFSTEQQALILVHEYSHLRRGDVLANALATGLRCIYWFNPLLHYASTRLRHDHELASDAEVLQRFPNSRRRYADTLLNAQLAVPGLPVGCLWQSSHPLKERIMMMKSPLPRPWRNRVGLVLGCLLIGSVGLTAWAAQPPQRVEGKASVSEASEQFAWLSQSITIAGQDKTLRQVIEHVVSGAGAQLHGGEELDRRFPEADIDYRFEDERVRNAVLVLLDDRGLEFSFSASGLTIHADGEPGYARLAAPEYPKSALDAKRSGTVVLSIHVLSSGKPGRIEIGQSSGHAALDEAAMLAAQSWTFQPARRKGEAIESWVKAPICFSLSEDDAECAAVEGALDTLTLRPPPSEADVSYRALRPPKYPQTAVDAQQSGGAVLRVSVSVDGTPGDVTVEKSSGTAALDEAAVAAVKGWTFNPAIKAGQPVGQDVLVPICFSLDEAQPQCEGPAEALDGIYIKPPQA